MTFLKPTKSSTRNTARDTKVRARFRKYVPIDRTYDNHEKQCCVLILIIDRVWSAHAHSTPPSPPHASTPWSTIFSVNSVHTVRILQSLCRCRNLQSCSAHPR